MILFALLVAAPALAQVPAPRPQKGIGPTGTMYDGNNLVRSPIAPRPQANPAPPAASGVTGAQGSRDEGGNGAGGGEH